MMNAAAAYAPTATPTGVIERYSTNSENDPLFDPLQVCGRIREGDSLAETQLILKYSKSITMMLNQLTRDWSLAQDLHQDTFCIVLLRLRSKRGISDPGKVAAFIHRTARNIYVDHARKLSRRRTYSDNELCAEVADTSKTQVSEVMAIQRNTIMRRIIADLSVVRDREILRRFYLEEQSKALICEHFQLSANQFDRVVSRARSRLREAVEQQYERGNVDLI